MNLELLIETMFFVAVVFVVFSHVIYFEIWIPS